MKSEPHDEFMGFELRSIPQHEDDCERWGYEVKLPTDEQWHEIDSHTLRWNRQDALEGLVWLLRRVIRQQMEKSKKLTANRDEAMRQNAKLRDIAERAQTICERWVSPQYADARAVKQLRSELDQLKEGAK
jgi:hypothetical protein